MVMERKYKLFGLAAVLFFAVVLHCGIGYAAASSKVMEKYCGESEIALYVKGSQEAFDNMTVQVGTAVCDTVEKHTLSEIKQPVRTLIVLDNSESIPKKDRKKISKILRGILSGRLENEQIALAVLNEQLEYLINYSADDEALKAAVNEITYRNTKTYLTDVLYEWFLTEYIPNQADSYYRIVVIADGTDNKPIGYTQDEFYSMLRQYPVPITSIGVKTKENNENLKNMFAISRASNAGSFLLSDTEQIQNISETLRADSQLVKIVIKPQEDLLDGNKKMVKILFASGETLSAEMDMPQVVKEQEETDVQNSGEEENANQTELADLEKEEKSETSGFDKKKIWMIAAVAAAIFVFALAAVLIWAVRKKKRCAQPQQERIADHAIDRMLEQKPDAQEDKTDVFASSEPQKQGYTVVGWNPDISYQLVLKNVNTAAKTIQYPLNKCVVIGRKAEISDIVFADDRTISGRHCEIAVRDGRFYITDLKSSNGTYVNGRRVVSEMEIFPGDLLRIGKQELKMDIKS